MSNKVYLTNEGFLEIEEELNHLKEVKRPEIIKALKDARALGDLSENADYDAARNKQAIIEGQIRDLEFTLSNIEVADVKASKNKITATSAVVVYDYADEEEYTYQLVGSIGSDPASGKITTESSLGAALLGKEVGDEIEVICGDGSSYKVLVKEIK